MNRGWGAFIQSALCRKWHIVQLANITENAIDRPRIDWHSGIPNHLCAFTDSFDENHCAAYVYVWEEIHRLKCTLRISNIDGAHYADLPYISKSLDDREIAKRVIDLVITGTERLKARGTIGHVIGSECWLSSSQLHWYSAGGL